MAGQAARLGGLDDPHGKPAPIIGTEADGAPIGYGYNDVFDAKITGHYVYATPA